MLVGGDSIQGRARLSQGTGITKSSQKKSSKNTEFQIVWAQVVEIK
jgi:hypothetical protein